MKLVVNFVKPRVHAAILLSRWRQGDFRVKVMKGTKSTRAASGRCSLRTHPEAIKAVRLECRGLDPESLGIGCEEAEKVNAALLELT